MHRYEELEKLYYKKKLLKYIFFFLLFLILILAIFVSIKVLNNKNKKVKSNDINTSKIKTKKENNNSSNVKLKSNLTVKKNNTKNIINKKLQNKPQNNITENEKKINKLTFILPELSSNDIAIANEASNNKEKNLTKKSSEKKSLSQNNNISEKNIKIVETNANVNALINQFNISPNYDLAITISKYFYNHKNYKKSQIWAIKANNIDPSKVESWILFADILLKEGKKNKAKKILSIYIDQYGNNDKIIKKLRSISE